MERKKYSQKELDEEKRYSLGVGMASSFMIVVAIIVAIVILGSEAVGYSKQDFCEEEGYTNWEWEEMESPQ